MAGQGQLGLRPRFNLERLQPHDFDRFHKQQMLGESLVSGLLYAGFMRIQQQQQRSRVFEILVADEVTAISGDAEELGSVSRYKESAAAAMRRLVMQAEAGKHAYLLMPLYCPQPPHFVAGVFDVNRGTLCLYDSFDTDVAFACAPDGGGVLAHITSRLPAWQSWLGSIALSQTTTITYDKYNCLGQQDDGWRCGLFTVYNLLCFAQHGFLAPAANMPGGRADVQSRMMQTMSQLVHDLQRKCGAEL